MKRIVIILLIIILQNGWSQSQISDEKNLRRVITDIKSKIDTTKYFDGNIWLSPMDDSFNSGNILVKQLVSFVESKKYECYGVNNFESNENWHSVALSINNTQTNEYLTKNDIIYFVRILNEIFGNTSKYIDYSLVVDDLEYYTQWEYGEYLFEIGSVQDKFENKMKFGVTSVYILISYSDRFKKIEPMKGIEFEWTWGESYVGDMKFPVETENLLAFSGHMILDFYKSRLLNSNFVVIGEITYISESVIQFEWKSNNRLYKYQINRFTGQMLHENYTGTNYNYLFMKLRGKIKNINSIEDKKI
jgi:hypothetical protein